jgi:holo-[acyl-carrier protein] synthase
MRVLQDTDGKPSFEFFGKIAEAVARRGIGAVHLSLTHDGDSACAFVVAERAEGSA